MDVLSRGGRGKTGGKRRSGSQSEARGSVFKLRMHQGELDEHGDRSSDVRLALEQPQKSDFLHCQIDAK